MIKIVPAVLAKTEEEFQKKVSDKNMRELASIFQIDILDGSMFSQSNWADPRRAASFDLPDLELHLMIENPLPTTRKWVKKTGRVVRSIIHAEIKAPLAKTISKIRKLNIQAGVALSPGTSLDSIKNELQDVDMLLVMGVEPGMSGQEFLGEPILKKIRAARESFPNLPIAVDGGVNEKTAPAIVAAGATQLCMGSALWQAQNLKKLFTQLAK